MEPHKFYIYFTQEEPEETNIQRPTSNVEVEQVKKQK